jgi:hypothetical protein
MKSDLVTPSPISFTNRRRKRQGGNEIIEFAVIAVFLVPLFLWVFVNGMNLLRIIQCNQICRDIGSLYIHGVDYSTYQAQQVAARLANGFGLQVGSSFTGNVANNDGNSGTGYVVLSEVMYVGSNTCASLPSGTACTNQNQYVFLERIDFGNKSVQFNGNTVSSALGNPTASLSTAGIVQNFLTDSGAVASNFASFMQTQLADGQVIYVAETFFSSSQLGFSAYPAGGLYTRTFF